MIPFDFSRCGVTAGELESLSAAVSKVDAILEEERRGKKVGWWQLPFDEEQLVSIKKLSDDFRQRFETLVVLGIGGSTQGLKALLPPHSSVVVIDNPDPRTIRQIADRLDLSKTCFNVISKSGDTVETLALFDFFQKQCAALPSWQDHFVVTTEAGNGKLARIAREEKLKTLEIPKNCVGRFSVFSAVALFPLAFAGFDVDGLLAGARNALLRGEGDICPAYKNGALHTLLNRNHGKTISVMMPYADRLHEFGYWYSQLWAESLGKKGKGQTPLVALGPKDQHSLAQLILDGPKDKVITFVKIVCKKGDLFSELLEKEWEATSDACDEVGCPTITLTLPNLDAATLGELLMTYQIQTAFTGHLMQINPYDQPAVELIKKRLNR